jgi:hypothetical protein
MIFGCTVLVPEHSSKSKSEYYADKEECEKLARSFGPDGQEDFSIIDEIIKVRICLKNKGWTYVKKEND